jgi:ankyrin repeat protein
VEKNPDNVNGWTPLHLAAKAGHLKVCQLIIDNVADKNPQNFNSGVTPLQLASKRKHFEIVELIQSKLDETKLKDALIPFADEI